MKVHAGTRVSAGGSSAPKPVQQPPVPRGCQDQRWTRQRVGKFSWEVVHSYLGLIHTLRKFLRPMDWAECNVRVTARDAVGPCIFDLFCRPIPRHRFCYASPSILIICPKICGANAVQLKSVGDVRQTKPHIHIVLSSCTGYSIYLFWS